MFILDNSGKIKVSQGDTFTLNVLSCIPFQNEYTEKEITTDENGDEVEKEVLDEEGNPIVHPSDIVTLTVKKNLDSTDTVIKKTITEFLQCPKNEEQKVALFKFSSLDTSIPAGNYLYDIQIDYVEKGIRYTAMWPTKFVVVEDVTNNVFKAEDIGGIIKPIETPDKEEDNNE